MLSLAETGRRAGESCAIDGTFPKCSAALDMLSSCFRAQHSLIYPGRSSCPDGEVSHFHLPPDPVPHSRCCECCSSSCAI
ncbi:unnamed protein product [Mycena citricolor]|uniref:Uncharacterized protein n=1 Tax=Mycena citricolor TaxID=2018698 RepID=A0AAD2H3S8_9AGAR|nr:unnamed protein product [Mycena citricolor]